MHKYGGLSWSKQELEPPIAVTVLIVNGILAVTRPIDTQPSSLSWPSSMSKPAGWWLRSWPDSKVAVASLRSPGFRA